MRNIAGLLYSIQIMRRGLIPRPQIVRTPPIAYVDENGNDQPGCEARNERARRYGLANGVGVKQLGVHPGENGCEP